MVIDAGVEAGCLPDQIETFISRSYIPLPWQWEFHAQARQADLTGGPVDIGLGGARGPGKSHAVLSQAGLDDCQRVSGLKGLFLRQTGIAAKESFDDLVNKVLRGRVPYTKFGHILKFEGDSRIVLGGFQDQNDIDKYIGIEYDFIIVEELNQLTEDKYTKLRGSLRTSKPNWRPRMYTSFNPGGIGHSFVKQRYIIPHKEGTQKETRFIGSTYRANPYLNVEYIDYLESLSGNLGRAWREGEWDLFAGQAFDELGSIHVIKPFRLPDNTRFLAGYDYGYAHPFAFILLAITPDKKVYIIDYLWENKKRPDEQAKRIVDKLGEYEIPHIYIYAGTDIWSNKEGRDTIYEQLRNGVGKRATFVRAYTDRKQGVAEMRKLIAWRNTQSGDPQLKFFENCLPVFEQIREMQADEKKLEDVIKVNANENGLGGDDLFDACLIKNTKIKTVDGELDIQKITNQNLVTTSRGIRKTTGAFCSGYKKISILITSKGKIIVVTNNHPIKTPKGFVRLDALRYGDIVETWQSHRQFSLMGLLLGDTQSRQGYTYRDIITQVGIIRKKGLSHYIVRYGRKLMGKFPRVLTFITKTIIQAITQLKTLFLYLKRNIVKSTKDRLKILESILRKSDHLRLSGISQKLDRHGTKNILKRCKINCILKKSIHVTCATKSLYQQCLNQDSAQGLVFRRIAEKARLIMWLGFARVVATILKLINIARQDSVPDCVFGLIENVGSSFVYNLEVERDHEYYANGILVHNCKYSIMARLYPNREPNLEIKEGSGAELMKFVKMKQRMSKWGY